MGTFTGTIIGGTIHSRDNYMRFIEKNQATAFQNHFEAKKQLQDKVPCVFCICTLINGKICNILELSWK